MSQPAADARPAIELVSATKRHAATFALDGAQDFLRNGRPLFNEDAYKLLVNQGQQERADRYLYNKPETVLSMTLKGPGASTQGAIDIWNRAMTSSADGAASAPSAGRGRDAVLVPPRAGPRHGPAEGHARVPATIFHRDGVVRVAEITLTDPHRTRVPR